MKRVLIALDVIFLLLVVVVAAFFGYAAMTGGKLDNESKAYVDAAVPAIVSSWNDQELLTRASPEFQKAASPPMWNDSFVGLEYSVDCRSTKAHRVKR
jgi:hypothetical protein